MRIMANINAFEINDLPVIHDISADYGGKRQSWRCTTCKIRRRSDCHNARVTRAEPAGRVREITNPITSHCATPVTSQVHESGYHVALPSMVMDSVVAVASRSNLITTSTLAPPWVG